MDSDYEEDQDYGVTSVLLGFPENHKTPSEHVGPNDNHLGGRPIWLDENSSPKDISITKCKSCKKLMPLLAQISAPLADTYYERAIYVFACRAPECRRKEGSIRAVKSIKRDEDKEASLEQADREAEEAQRIKDSKGKGAIQADLFQDLTQKSDAANPFSNSNPFASSNPFAAKENATSSKETKGDVSKTTIESSVSYHVEDIGRPEFPCYLIEVDYEELVAPKVDPELLKRIVTEEKVEEEDEDVGESSKADAVKSIENPHADLVFQNFIEIVDNNPDQVLRYERPLKPLYFSANDVLKEKPADKELELQVMPHTIMTLEADEDDILNGMEWGTIFIATGNDDLAGLSFDESGVAYAEEWVGVQWEEAVEFESQRK